MLVGSLASISGINGIMCCCLSAVTLPSASCHCRVIGQHHNQRLLKEEIRVLLTSETLGFSTVDKHQPHADCMHKHMQSTVAPRCRDSYSVPTFCLLLYSCGPLHLCAPLHHRVSMQLTTGDTAAALDASQLQNSQGQSLSTTAASPGVPARSSKDIYSGDMRAAAALSYGPVANLNAVKVAVRVSRAG